MTEPGAQLDALLAQGRFAEALALIDGWPQRAAEQLLLRGRVLTMMGQIEQAIETLQDALAGAVHNPLLRAECLIEIAIAYSRRGDDEALQRAGECLDAAEALAPDQRLRGQAELTRAALALKTDGHAAALPLLLRARARLEPFAAEYVRALDATGSCWAALGDTVRARGFLEHAIETKAELGDIYGLAISYGQLGRLFLRLRELDAAERAFREDLQLCQRMNDQRGEAQSLNHLGQVAIGRGDAAAARQHLLAARALTPPDHAGYGLLMKDMAELCMLEGDLDGAERAGRVAAESLAASSLRYNQALLDHVSARLALARGDEQTAQEQLERALDGLEAIDARLDQLPVLVDLAEAHRLQGQHRAHVHALSQALDLAEAARADTWVMDLERMLERADPTRWLEQVLSKVRGVDQSEPRADRADYALRAQSRFVVVLFSDMVGFTAWSSQRNAEQVVETLNDYFGRMAVAVQDNGGTIDKYIGDGLMVLFADDDSHERLAQRGCQCALDMLVQLESWNRDRLLLGREPFRMRIGLNAGTTVMGNMGSYLKVAHTTVGRAVNLAARLETMSEPDRVLCGSSVHELGQGEFVFQERGIVEPKGLEPERTWWLQGRSGRPGRTLVG